MTRANHAPVDPPEAPDTPRRPRLYRAQWIGLPLIIAFPLLALLGVFGERWHTQRVESGALDVSVRHPTVFRYKMIDAIEVHVRNRGAQPIDTATVSLDTAYAGRFSTVTAIPSFDGAFDIDLAALQPGESRRVRIEIQAERYWTHRGELTVAAGTDTVRAALTTRVFP
jgi:hypothetical protein